MTSKSFLSERTHKVEWSGTVIECIASVGKHLDEYKDLIAELVNIDSGEDAPDGILAVEQTLAGMLLQITVQR